ncbi:MAG TPA: hypothetical protein VGL33_27570 [Streptosporangiaceae bacterium]
MGMARAELDEMAVRSHALAHAVAEAGIFRRQRVVGISQPCSADVSWDVGFG